MRRDPQRTMAVLAVIGLAGCGVGLLIDPRTMLASYLVIWMGFSAMPIGALAVQFTSYLARGRWTHDLYPPLAKAALTIPVFALLFIPVLVGLDLIYPWAAGAQGLPPFKAVYLTPWFFVVRMICYFLIWTALGIWAARAYGDERAMTRAASAGLIVWTLTVSWAGIDWLESIEPQFHSSTYGLLAISFCLMAGFCFPLVVRLSQRRPRQMSNAAYSGLLLSILMLWAYLHAMQYIIVWSGNLPDEMDWYLTRLDGGWRFVLWTLFIGQFFLPFFALLSEDVRSNTSALFRLAAATLVLRFVEAAVLILPPLHVTNAALAICLPAATLMIGASWWLAWQAVDPIWTRWSDRPATAH